MNEFNFELEFVSIQDLCTIVKRIEIEINKLQKHIDLFGQDDSDFNAWMLELCDLRERHDYLQRRIRSRQAKIEKQHPAAAISLS
jgi:hypothetical protein